MERKLRHTKVMMNSSEMKILMVEDDSDFAHLLGKRLTHVNQGILDLNHVTHLGAAIKRLAESRFDLILLDLSLPDSRGLETFYKIQEKELSIPIVLLTGIADAELESQALEGGAQDYLIKGQIDEKDLLRALNFAIKRHQILQEWKKACEIEKNNATHDPLTGLPNRILFHDRLTQAMARARRRQERIAVLFIDLDRFKSVNDSLGHLVGDQLLKMVAERLQMCVRAEDTVARFAGDEFLAILSGIQQAEDAVIVAERIQKAIAYPYLINQQKLIVTASIGISLSKTSDIDLTKLVEKADLAMYFAKESGGSTWNTY